MFYPTDHNFNRDTIIEKIEKKKVIELYINSTHEDVLTHLPQMESAQLARAVEYTDSISAEE